MVHATPASQQKMTKNIIIQNTYVQTTTIVAADTEYAMLPVHWLESSAVTIFLDKLFDLDSDFILGYPDFDISILIQQFPIFRF